MIICSFCKSHTATLYKLTNSNQVIRNCKVCKNAFTWPFPVIPDYVELDFHSVTKTSGEEKLTQLANLPTDWQDLINTQVEIVKQKFPANSRILEIGCGEGILLDLLKSAGFNVTGVEPSASGSARAKSRGLNIYTGYFPHPQMNETFDLVNMSQVLEHIENPVEFLNTLKKYIPNGYVMLTQTNYKGIIPRILKEKWYAWVPEQHFWHFSPSGLDFIMEKCGYELVKRQFCTLVHPHNLLYRIALLYPSFQDQFVSLYRLKK